MRYLDAQTLAYIAGVIDGEGCIAIRRTKARGSLSTRYSVSVTVGNTNRALILRLVRAFNAGSVIYRYPTRKTKGCYLWSLSSGGARAVLDAVLPYLVVKQGQAAVVLEFIHGFRSYKGAPKGHFGGVRVPAEELARRARLYEEVSALNQVGPADGWIPRAGQKKSVGVTADFRATGEMLLLDTDRLDPVSDPDS